jgi:hypothetical protein
MSRIKLIYVNKQLDKILLKQKKIAKKYKKKDTSFIRKPYFLDLDFVFPCKLENKKTN